MSEHPGVRLRRIRKARNLSQGVVAGLAGISKSYLSRLENGERALDRRQLISALANALNVTNADITGHALPAVPESPDSRLDAIRGALISVAVGEAQGQAQSLENLSERASIVLDAARDCDYRRAGSDLPELIHDLHATLAAGKHKREVSALAALVHIQGAQATVGALGADDTLMWTTGDLARRAADESEDPVARAVAAFGTALGSLLPSGQFDLADRMLASADPGTDTEANAHLHGMVTLARSLSAAAATRGADQQAALEHAVDLAGRIDHTDPMTVGRRWFGWSPENVALWRMSVAVENADHGRAAAIGDAINPAALPSPTRRFQFHITRARALCRLPRRQGDAVRSLRAAEDIAPSRVRVHQGARSVMVELAERAKREALGELRGLAHRSGLEL